MNLKLIQKKFNNRFVFGNTTFSDTTFFPTYRFTDVFDNIEYEIETPSGVDLEQILVNIISEKRENKINNVFK